MKNRIFYLLILVFILNNSCSVSSNNKSIYIKDISIAPEDFKKDFTQINKIINKNYSLLEHKNINTDQLLMNYMEKINQISTSTEYGKTLLEYFAELHNSHTTLYFKKYRLNCSAKLVEGRIFIDKIDSDLLKKMGIHTKDEIIEIDNIPVIKWIQQQEKYISSSTQADRVQRSVWNIFNSYWEENRKFLIKTQQGEETITIKLDEENNSDRWENIPLVNQKFICDSIGYLAINSMMGNIINEFKKKFQPIKHLPYLIIDIRRNGGGNSGNSEIITEYLIKQKQKACVSGKKLIPHKDHYKGKIFVLTDVSTFSAAESFALDMKDSGNAILIGSPTGGDTGNQPRNFKTKQNISFRIPTRKPAQISPNGFFMEGQGIEPHHNVNLTLNDYLSDIDTVLVYTIGLIKDLKI